MNKVCRTYVFLISIGVVILVSFATSRFFQNWIVERDRNTRLDLQYTYLIDSCFRLRLEQPRESDVNKFCEQIFTIWLSDREATKRVFSKNYSFSENSKLMILKASSSKDPLNIKSFGSIEVKQDSEHIVFFGTDTVPQNIRLVLIFRARDSQQILGSYNQITDQFLIDSALFFSRITKPIQRK